MNIDLNGRHALVTGASQGIGEAIGRQLHAQGARVTLIARTQAKLDAVTQELDERTLGVAAEVMKAEELTARA